MTAPSPTVPAPGSTVRDALDIAAGRPAGSERVALVEEAARLALETGDESGEVAARLALVDASWEGSPWGAVEPFMWCIARRRQRPELFTAEQSHALGQDYLWVGIAAASNPTVPVARVRVLEQGVDALAAELDLFEHVLEDQRRVIALYLGRPDEARAAYQR